MERFIPAGVGNTNTSASPMICCSVHPRWCGEHQHQCQPNDLLFGSSPLVWGTPENKHLFYVHNRFIPAGVGNTPVVVVTDDSDAVHPRWCGEHRRRHCRTARAFGSSPLVWGTQSALLFCNSQLRFIPAGVGNTLSLMIK